ncbi:hypothetical protein BDW59DRAFT_160352 [Aspergillus cavernicola]|uniref:Transcription factor domain-containing protein n=1 Tax=Aspergillus cavernicola TaxID=176166 RepID=A0ABR4II27_9EURO
MAMAEIFRPIPGNLPRATGVNFKLQPLPAPGKLRGRFTPADEELYQVYQGAVLDHFQILFDSPEGGPETVARNGNNFKTLTLLQDTLAICLPSFPSLRSIGLRHYVDHTPPPINVRGIQRLRNQLGFNPVEPSPLLVPRKPGPPEWGERFRMDVFDASVFATLVAAIAEASKQIKLEILETGGLMADNDQLLSLFLQPILSHLRHLSVTIASTHIEIMEREKLQQAEDKLLSLLQRYNSWNSSTTIDRDPNQQQQLLPILASAAPVLETFSLFLPLTSAMLAYGHRHSIFNLKSGLDLADSHFNWMAHNFRLASLHTLSLSSMVIDISSFATFLETARPTLRILSIRHVHWTNERVFEKSREAEIAEEAERVCRLIFVYLRDCFLLESLFLLMWYYQGSSIRCFDPDRLRSRFPSRFPPLVRRYMLHANCGMEKTRDQLWGLD